MVFAAIVVLDFFDGVPVTVTQSPLVTELTASVTVLEKAVVVVQLTVVCPEVVLCTSMLDPLREATLPVAPVLAGAGGAGRRGDGGGGEERGGARPGQTHEAPTGVAPAGQ